MQITTVGLDLAKSVFQVHAVDASGDVVVRKTLRRSQVLPFFTRVSTRGSGLTTWTPRPRLLRHNTWRGCGRNTSGACNEMVCALPTGGLARKPTDLARRPRNWRSPSRFVEGRIPSNCLNRALFGSPAPAPLGGWHLQQ